MPFNANLNLMANIKEAHSHLKDHNKKNKKKPQISSKREILLFSFDCQYETLKVFESKKGWIKS